MKIQKYILLGICVLFLSGCATLQAQESLSYERCAPGYSWGWDNIARQEHCLENGKDYSGAYQQQVSSSNKKQDERCAPGYSWGWDNIARQEHCLENGKDYSGAYQTNYNVNNQDSYQREQLIIQQQQLEIQRQQLEQQRQIAEEQDRRDSYNRAINSINNLGNQLNQNAYNTNQYSNSLQNTIDANNQRRQDKQFNYQLRQINNNLNGIRYGY